MSINHATSKKEFESTIYWIGKRSSILHYMKRKHSLENRSYDVSILESGNDVIYIPTTQFYNKLDTSNLERYL